MWEVRSCGRETSHGLPAMRSRWCGRPPTGSGREPSPLRIRPWPWWRWRNSARETSRRSPFRRAQIWCRSCGVPTTTRPRHPLVQLRGEASVGYLIRRHPACAPGGTGRCRGVSDDSVPSAYWPVFVPQRVGGCRAVPWRTSSHRAAVVIVDHRLRSRIRPPGCGVTCRLTCTDGKSASAGVVRAPLIVRPRRMVPVSRPPLEQSRSPDGWRRPVLGQRCSALMGVIRLARHAG